MTHYISHVTHHRLHVLQNYWFVQNHLVEWSDEKRCTDIRLLTTYILVREYTICMYGTIQEVLVVDGQAYHTSDELEVVQMMFIVHTRL